MSPENTFLADGLAVTLHVGGDFVLDREGADDRIAGPTQIMRNLSHLRWQAWLVFKGMRQARTRLSFSREAGNHA